MARGREGHGKFGKNCSAFCDDVARHRQMFLRLNLHESAAEDGDGSSARVHGGLMGGGVDPVREAGDDGPAGIGRGFRNMLSHPQSVNGRPAGADNRDRLLLLLFRKRAAEIETERGVLQFPERFGIILVRAGVDFDSAECDPVEFLVQKAGFRFRRDPVCQLAADAPDRG